MVVRELGINKLSHTKGGMILKCTVLNGKRSVCMAAVTIYFSGLKEFICTIELMCKIKSKHVKYILGICDFVNKIRMILKNKSQVFFYKNLINIWIVG